MADKLGLSGESKTLKIGQSFTNPKSTSFHAIRYDFKPASVDLNKMASVDVGNNNQVTLTVPHLDGAGVPQTVFKGSQRPFHKECVLIIDRSTGEITLEKLSGNIQVKKTRSEAIAKPQLHPSDRPGQNAERSSGSALSVSRSQTPPIGQRNSTKTKVTSGSRRPDRQITHLVPKHSPLQASPNYPSPGNPKSPKREREVVINNDHHQSTLASLPMIGIDDYIEPMPNHSVQTIEKSPNIHVPDPENGVEVMSDTSSSSSSSDSESDNGNVNKTVINKSSTNGHTNGLSNNTQSAHILNEDLCLSESGSDSD